MSTKKISLSYYYYSMTFRDRLREEIEYSGLLDKEVAEKAGITKRAIDSYVGSRACMPAADVAARIASVLGVTVEYLVFGKNQNNNISSKNEKELLSIIQHLSERDKNILISLARLMSRL